MGCDSLCFFSVTYQNCHDDFSRLMLLEENQIAFHSQDGLIFDGVKDYSRQIAEMIGLGSDTELPQAGVSLPLVIITNCCFLGNHNVLWGLVLCITWFSKEDYAIQPPISFSIFSLMTALFVRYDMLLIYFVLNITGSNYAGH